MYVCIYEKINLRKTILSSCYELLTYNYKFIKCSNAYMKYVYTQVYIPVLKAIGQQHQILRNCAFICNFQKLFKSTLVSICVGEEM